MDSRRPQWGTGVRERIYEHVYAHLDREVGGVLVGGLEGSGRLEVRGAIPALNADGKRSRVTFTHDAWAAVHRTLEEDFPEQRIIGWYHSHPGFGIFLSRHDLFIHEHFFSAPHQIALVVDPHASTEGTFGWVGGEVRPLDGVPERQLHGRATASRSNQSRDYSHRALVALATLGALLGTIAWLAFLGDGQPVESAPEPNRAPQPTPLVPEPQVPPEEQPPDDDGGAPPHAPRPRLSPLISDQPPPARPAIVVSHE